MVRSSPVPPAQRAAVFGLVAELIEHPDAELLAARSRLRAAVWQIAHPGAAAALEWFFAWFDTVCAAEAAQHHARTFAAAGRGTGCPGEDGRRLLPEPLPVLLRRAADGLGRGETPLFRHRASLEQLRADLVAAGSPYRHLLDAVCLALPAAAEEGRALREMVRLPR